MIVRPNLICLHPLFSLAHNDSLSATGNFYPRDIGHSSKLSNGTVIWQFGDTFCYNFQGDFLGVTDNTCSVGHVQDPTLSSYSKAANGSLEDNISNSQFGDQILTPLLGPFPNFQGPNSKNIKLWPFSGIVEHSCSSEFLRGWSFYELSTYKDGSVETDIQAVVVAEVTHQRRTGITKATLAGQGDHLLFRVCLSNKMMTLLHLLFKIIFYIWAEKILIY